MTNVTTIINRILPAAGLEPKRPGVTDGNFKTAIGIVASRADQILDTLSARNRDADWQNDGDVFSLAGLHEQLAKSSGRGDAAFMAIAKAASDGRGQFTRESFENALVVASKAIAALVQQDGQANLGDDLKSLRSPAAKSLLRLMADFVADATPGDEALFTQLQSIGRMEADFYGEGGVESEAFLIPAGRFSAPKLTEQSLEDVLGLDIGTLKTGTEFVNGELASAAYDVVSTLRDDQDLAKSIRDDGHDPAEIFALVERELDKAPGVTPAEIAQHIVDVLAANNLEEGPRRVIQDAIAAMPPFSFESVFYGPNDPGRTLDQVFLPDLAGMRVLVMNAGDIGEVPAAFLKLTADGALAGVTSGVVHT